MSKISSALSDRWVPNPLSIPKAARDPDPAGHPRSGFGQRTLDGSSHKVCLGDSKGHVVVRGEWELAFSRESGRTEAGARVLTQERVRFRADAARLRNLAFAMLAGARELEAIEAHIAPVNRGGRIDPDYLETITLTEHGIGPSFESPMILEPSD
jgi:hypothetical protein